MTECSTPNLKNWIAEFGALRSRAGRSFEWILLMVFVVVAFLGTVVEAEDDVEDAAMIVEKQYSITEAAFDRAIFGNQGTFADAKKWQDTTLANEIEVVDRKCSLSDTQKRKLSLAGKGDILRAFEPVEELRRKVTLKPTDILRHRQHWRETWALKAQFPANVFHGSSLFQKTLRGILSEAQRASYATLNRERQAKLLEATVLAWDGHGRSSKLTDSQRQQLLDVMLRKMTPPSVPPQRVESHVQTVLLLQAAELESELKPILSDSQWDVFQRQIKIAKQQEPILKQNGFWPPRQMQDDGESDPETRNG